MLELKFKLEQFKKYATETDQAKVKQLKHLKKNICYNTFYLLGKNLWNLFKIYYKSKKFQNILVLDSDALTICNTILQIVNLNGNSLKYVLPIVQ